MAPGPGDPPEVIGLPVAGQVPGDRQGVIRPAPPPPGGSWSRLQMRAAFGDPPRSGRHGFPGVSKRFSERLNEKFDLAIRRGKNQT